MNFRFDPQGANIVLNAVSFDPYRGLGSLTSIDFLGKKGEKGEASRRSLLR